MLSRRNRVIFFFVDLVLACRAQSKRYSVMARLVSGVG